MPGEKLGNPGKPLILKKGYNKLQEKQIVIEAIAGDSDKLSRLLDSVRTMVRARLKLKLAPESVEDAEQEVRYKIVEKIHNFRLSEYDRLNEDGSERSNIFYIWIYNCIIKDVIRNFRKENSRYVRKTKEGAEEDRVEKLIDQIQIKEQDKASPEAIFQRSENHRDVLEFILMEGGPPHQVITFLFHLIIKFPGGINGIVHKLSGIRLDKLALLLERDYLEMMRLKKDSMHYREIQHVFAKFRDRLKIKVVDLIYPNSPHRYIEDILYTPAGETMLKDYFCSNPANDISGWSSRLRKKITLRLVELGIQQSKGEKTCGA